MCNESKINKECVCGTPENIEYSFVNLTKDKMLFLIQLIEKKLKG